MKAKTLCLLAGTAVPLILTGRVQAGFTGISTVSKPNPFGLLVVNVYAVFDRPGQDLMIAIAGTADNPLLIQVHNGTFFNSGFGGDKAPNSTFFPAFPTLEFDTFVTIGIKFTNPLNDALIIAPDFGVGITGTQLSFSNSAWAVTPVDAQADPFDPAYAAGNGSVLLAQFSTEDGTAISGTFLMKYTGNGVPGVASVVSFFHVPGPGALWLLGAAGLLGSRRRRRGGRHSLDDAAGQVVLAAVPLEGRGRDSHAAPPRIPCALLRDIGTSDSTPRSGSPQTGFSGVWREAAAARRRPGAAATSPTVVHRGLQSWAESALVPRDRPLPAVCVSAAARCFAFFATSGRLIGTKASVCRRANCSSSLRWKR